MEKEIQIILNELYEMDDSLKEKEAELRKIIATMLKIKPQISIDNSFKQELQNKLLSEIQTKNSQYINQYTKKGNIFSYFSLIFGSLGFIALGIAFFLQFFAQNNQESTFQPLSGVQQENIAKIETPLLESSQKKIDNNIVGNQMIFLGKEGFGNLKHLGNNNSLNENVAAEVSTDTLSEKSVFLQESKNNNQVLSPQVTMDSEFVNQGESIEGGISGTEPGFSSEKEMSDEVQKNMVYEKQKTPKYIYTGSLDIINQSFPIYKEITGEKISTQDMNQLKNSSFGGISLEYFSDPQIESISFNENVPFGLNVQFDFRASMIHMYKNISKWENNISSSPASLGDDEIKQIAIDFFKDNNLSLKNYGKPTVEKISEISNSPVASYPEKSNGTLPTTANVFFPFLINNYEVIEEYGGRNGMQLEIDLINKKVSNLYGFYFGSFGISEYKIENNPKNILKVAEVGGRQGLQGQSNGNAIYYNVPLYNPKIVYVSMYSYENNVSNHYFIPSVVFEIKREKTDPYDTGAQNIIVPLVKDFYEYDANGNIIGK